MIQNLNLGSPVLGAKIPEDMGTDLLNRYLHSTIIYTAHITHIITSMYFELSLYINNLTLPYCTFLCVITIQVCQYVKAKVFLIINSAVTQKTYSSMYISYSTWIRKNCLTCRIIILVLNSWFTNFIFVVSPSMEPSSDVKPSYTQ